MASVGAFLISGPLTENLCAIRALIILLSLANAAALITAGHPLRAPRPVQQREPKLRALLQSSGQAWEGRIYSTSIGSVA
jgi:hypothetical protein